MTVLWARSSSPVRNPRHRSEQRGGVEGVGGVVLAQHAAVADAIGEDVVADLVGGRPPGVAKVVVTAELGKPRRSVERHPAHQLRRDVVLRLAASLPDALIGLRPHAGGAWSLAPGRSATGSAAGACFAGVQEDRVEHGAEHVVLPLIEGTVADTNRTRTGVAAEVVQGRLGEVAPAVDAVHDLQRAVVVRLRSAMNCMNSSASQSRFNQCRACRVNVESRIQV